MLTPVSRISALDFVHNSHLSTYVYDKLHIAYHVTLKTGVIADEMSAMHHRNK